MSVDAPANGDTKIRVNNGDLSQLRIATDDHIQKYLSTLYKQDHRYTDFKLIVGYLAVAIAAWGAYVGYVNKDFSQTKGVTLVSVVGYFLLNGALMAHAWFVEKGCVFLGYAEDPKHTLRVMTATKKYSDVYEITLECFTSVTDKHSHIIAKSFGKWFDEEGTLVAHVLETDLKKAVEACKEKMEMKRR